MRVSLTMLVTLLMLVLLVALPGAAGAADGLPDEIVDPAAAVQPTQPAPGPTGTGGDAVAEATGGDVAIVAGDAAATRTHISPAASAVTAPAYVALGARGSLPFTGADSGRITWLLIVASLLCCAGATAWSYSSDPVRSR